MYQRTFKRIMLASALSLAAASSVSAADEDHISFPMIVSKGASACLPHAQATVHIISDGSAEDMFLVATGLPPNTGFDFFVIQVPNAPFGLSWYQGDVRSDADGDAVQHFRGRFSIETFIVAPGVAPAPLVFNDQPFPDAAHNPATGPVQTYHLGLWFNSPADAQKAGCLATVTPFNGEHNAGIQVLNTSNYRDDHGPLRDLRPWLISGGGIAPAGLFLASFPKGASQSCFARRQRGGSGPMTPGLSPPSGSVEFWRGDNASPMSSLRSLASGSWPMRALGPHMTVPPPATTCIDASL